jgi:hypothetical protein
LESGSGRGPGAQPSAKVVRLGPAIIGARIHGLSIARIAGGMMRPQRNLGQPSGPLLFFPRRQMSVAPAHEYVSAAANNGSLMAARSFSSWSRARLPPYAPISDRRADIRPRLRLRLRSPPRLVRKSVIASRPSPQMWLPPDASPGAARAPEVRSSSLSLLGEQALLVATPGVPEFWARTACLSSFSHSPPPHAVTRGRHALRDRCPRSGARRGCSSPRQLGSIDRQEGARRGPFYVRPGGPGISGVKDSIYVPGAANERSFTLSDLRISPLSAAFLCLTPPPRRPLVAPDSLPSSSHGRAQLRYDCIRASRKKLNNNRVLGRLLCRATVTSASTSTSAPASAFAACELSRPDSPPTLSSLFFTFISP